MDINQLLTALKDAMEAEMTGHQFYLHAAKTTVDFQGKATFARMAQEELDHFHALKKQYVAVLENGKFDHELAVSLVSALRGEYGLAIGNIVGSNIFNLLGVIGVAATIAPIGVEQSVLSLHIFVMVAFTLVLFAMTHDYDGKSELSRIEGFALLAAFIGYDSYVVWQNVNMA